MLTPYKVWELSSDNHYIYIYNEREREREEKESESKKSFKTANLYLIAFNHIFFKVLLNLIVYLNRFFNKCHVV